MGSPSFNFAIDPLLLCSIVSFSSVHQPQERKDMYGAKMMGGADPAAEDGKEDERSDESFEPAFYHHLPETLYSDAIGAYEIRGCLASKGAIPWIRDDRPALLFAKGSARGVREDANEV